MQEELLKTFLAESEELIEDIDENLLALEKLPASKEIVDKLFRAFHTLKGSAGLVGFQDVMVVAHGLEDVLDEIRSGKRSVNTKLINLLLSGSDLLRAAIQMEMEGEKLPKGHLAGYLAELNENSSENTAVTMSREEKNWQDKDLSHIPLEKRTVLLSLLLDKAPLYYTGLTCPPDIFYRAVDPLSLFISAVKEGSGNFLYFSCSAEDLPTVQEFDPEQCYLRLEGITELGSLDNFLASLEFIADEAEIEAFPLSPEMLFAENLIFPLHRTEQELIKIEELVNILKTGPTGSKTDILAKLDEFLRAAREVQATFIRWQCETGYLNDSILLAHLLHIFVKRNDTYEDALNVIVEHVLELLNEYLSTYGEGAYPTLSPAAAAEEILELITLARPDSAGTLAVHKFSIAAPDHAPRSEMLRVESKKVDKLMELAEELMIIKNSLEYWLNAVQKAITEEAQAQAIKEQHLALSRVTREIQDEIATMRMVPIGQVFQKFTRFVRDTALKLGKEVSISFKGEDTCLDKNVVESLYEPLLHLIRNSIDHGMETSEDRRRAGKKVPGCISLNAYREGSSVIVEVEDDGRGIDCAKVLEKAVAKGLITVEEAERLSVKEIIRLIFKPGFSTADSITDISGRGVGMDAVLTVVEGLGGTVDLDSEEQKGTVVKISVPLTVTTSRVLVIQAGKVEVGIAVEDIERISSASKDQLRDYNGHKLITQGNNVVPLVHLGELLAVSGQENSATDEYRIVTLYNGVGAIVDKINGDENVVVRKIAGEIGQLPMYKGAALRGNGKVLMVLDAGYLKGCLGHAV